MRVLVATQRSNGLAAGDYMHGVEGELVYMQEPCASDLRNPEGPCGCGRGFAGMNSHRATTTALVTDSELNREEIREALRSSLEAGGWIDPASITAGPDETLVDEWLHDMLRVAEHFRAGSVVRRRLSQYYVGSAPGAETR